MHSPFPAGWSDGGPPPSRCHACWLGERGVLSSILYFIFSRTFELNLIIFYDPLQYLLNIRVGPLTTEYLTTRFLSIWQHNIYYLYMLPLFSPQASIMCRQRHPQAPLFHRQQKVNAWGSAFGMFGCRSTLTPCTRHRPCSCILPTTDIQCMHMHCFVVDSFASILMHAHVVDRRPPCSTFLSTFAWALLICRTTEIEGTGLRSCA